MYKSLVTYILYFITIEKWTWQIKSQTLFHLTNTGKYVISQLSSNPFQPYHDCIKNKSYKITPKSKTKKKLTNFTRFNPLPKHYNYSHRNTTTYIQNKWLLTSYILILKFSIVFLL